MDNSKVNRSHRIGVIIENGERTLDEQASDGKLFLKFTKEGPLISGSIEGLSQPVPIIDMPADTDRSFLE